MYMREYWVQVHSSPIVYRYVDWTITVPLQMNEFKVIKPLFGFIGGMCGWAFILFEIFLGEAGGTAAQCSQAIASSFKTMRLIVTIGWSIYPLGYFFGYLHGAISDESLNIIYNIADFVNKIAFVLSCWVA